jgi:outer membrane protein OmpA-like peptidoglycan-associated protein
MHVPEIKMILRTRRSWIAIISLFICTTLFPSSSNAASKISLNITGGSSIPGLVGYWDFSDRNNLGKNKVDDSSLQLHNIDTTTSIVRLPNASGESATALTFNGTDGYLGGLVNNLPVRNSGYTIGAWIKISNTSGDKGIIGWGNYGYPGQVNAFRSDCGDFGLLNYSWGPDTGFCGGSSFQNQWKFVLATYDGRGTQSGNVGIRRIFVNGESITAQSIDQLAVYQWDFNLTIGVTNGNEYFAGQMANVFVFNRALSQSEVSNLYNGTYAKQSTGDSIPNTCFGATAIQNGSFESIPIDEFWDAYDIPRQIGRVAMNFPNWCWQTTASSGQFSNAIEVQRLVNGTNDDSNSSLGDTASAINLINSTNDTGNYFDKSTAVPVKGSYFAEINAESPAMLYQDIVTTPGENLRWTISHKGRKTTSEAMHVEIGGIDGVNGLSTLNYSSQKIEDSRDEVGNAPSDFGAGASPYLHRVAGFQGQWDALSSSIQENRTVTLIGVQKAGGPILKNTPYSAGDLNPDYWGVYSGTYTVPSGQTLTRFAFVSDAADPSIGNLLDNVIFARVQNITWSQSNHLASNLNSSTISSATSDGDGALTYTVFDSGTANCVLTGMTLSWSSAGSCVIQAYATTTSNFSDAISRLTIKINHSVTFNPNNGSGSMSPQDSDTNTALAKNTFTRSSYTFTGWTTNADGTGTSYSDEATFDFSTDLILHAQWRANPPSGGGGGGGVPTPSAPTPVPQYPGVTWSPQDLVEGTAIDSTHQLNATFSVPGKAVYSVAEGFVPSVGSSAITVTFTPTDTTNYYVISTSRIIQVTAAPTPNPSPSASASPMASSSPTPKPTPSPTPTATKKPQSMKTSALTLVGTVYFNNNEYFIDGSDIATIKGVAAQLKKTHYKEVLVKGNTDIKLGVDNVWLSKARAEAVANTLNKYLKVPNLIRAWYASTKPVAIGLDKASLAKNRRVEIYALEEVDATAAPTPSPQASVSTGDLILTPVSFNRNEYFLSAQARKDLVADVQNLFKAGCRNVALVGTEDGTRGGLPNMGLLRAKAVRDFMKSLDPALTFDSLKKAISINREVRISCSQ